MGWTVHHPDTGALERGLSVEEAAVELLAYDGGRYEIRREADGDGWRLWLAQPVGGKPWTSSVVFSLEADEVAAWSDIARQVVVHPAWSGPQEALTDEAWDARMREMQEG